MFEHRNNGRNILNIDSSYDQNRFIEIDDSTIAFDLIITIQYCPVRPSDRYRADRIFFIIIRRIMYITMRYTNTNN